MAIRKRNMDQVFKNKLDGLNIKAPEDSWAYIESQIPQSDNSKPIYFYRYMAAASIALIAVSAALYSLFELSNSNTLEKTNLSAINPIIERKPLIIPDIKIYKTQIKDFQKDIINKSINAESKSESMVAELLPENLIIGNTENRENNLSKLQIKPVLLFTDIKFLDIKEYSSGGILENNVEEATNFLADNQQQKAKHKGQWALGVELAPSYSYRHLTSSGNQESVVYFNTVENPTKTFSGGFNVQYKVYKRLTIQSGVYYSQMGQSIGNMTIYDNKNYDNATPATKSNYISSITLTNSVGNININSKYVFVDQTNLRVNTSSENKFFFDPNDPSLSIIDSKVQQTFEYIDIPLMVRYKVVDKKIDVNIAAGISASFLVGNNVTLIMNETETNIGETKNINQNNYTGNIGLSLDLPIANRVTFRIEPSFRYFLNALNTDSEIKSHPYSFSVFSGFCLSL
ncbi:MAG: outer membrane beta-barrel protein [Bacteroidales bacterium]|jgi:hypothetical protein|nr:outer membrane beta-barrel protein [Bacteroidales bacterium]